MGVRETINKNQPIVITVVVVVAALAVGIGLWARSGDEPALITHAYYSDDDGKSYFEDSATRIVPFDHDGKEADRAYVFRADSGGPFVGYLMRLNPTQVKKMEQMKAQPMTTEVGQAIAAFSSANTQVKKPGPGQWVAMTSPEGRLIMNPTTPSGNSVDLTSVDPS